MLESVLGALDSERDTVIALQRALVAIPAIGPESQGDGEEAKAIFLKKQLAAWGFPAPLEMKAPDARVSCGYRPNLAYVFPGGDPSRTFWIIAHMDVVPVGDLSLWDTDPFTLEVKDDIIIGRGVEDNHQGLVSGVLLGKALAQTKTMPPINLGLLFVADEECGNEYGLEYVVKHHADLFHPNDLFLAPDHGYSSGLSIEIAEKGTLWLKVTVEGKQCHASTPHEGCNSLRAASDFIVRLKRLYEDFPKTDPLFNPPYSTFEPTKKEANVENVNTIPGKDVFYIDCRVLPSYDLQDVIAGIEKIGFDIVSDHGVSLSYQTVHRVNAAPATPVESDIVRRLSAAIRETYGAEPVPEGIGGGTVAAIIRARGYQAAVWSRLIHNPHQPNEKSSISYTIGDAKVMARALLAP